MTRNVDEISIQVSDTDTDVNESDVEKEACTPYKQNDKDIDGGWAWMVLAGATATFCVFGATMKGFGVFFNGFIEQFDASSSITSLISGVLHTTYSICTLPVLTVGLKYLSTRQFVVFTSILSSVAFIGGSFASRIEILLITNGLMAGLAFTCSHGPLMYLTGVYFVKRRNLSQAVAISGFTFGGLIFPPIYGYLIETYGLQGGMIITGGIQLNIIAFALLLRPKVINKIQHEKATEKESRYSLLNKDEIRDKNNILQQKMIQNIIHNDNKLYYTRKRSMSEIILINGVNSDMNRNDWSAYSEQHLPRQEHHGSLNKIVKTLSHSSITRVLSECDVVSASLCELQEPTLTSDDAISNEKGTCCTTNIIDCSLFKEPFMWIYALVYCFGRVPSAYLSIFIAPLAKEANVNSSNVAILVSLVNACDFVGMVTCGIIADRKLLRNYTVVILSLCITSICLALSPLCEKFWHFIMFSIATGIGAGGIFALTPSIVVDFIGLEKFRSAMGILVLLQGASLGLSAPLMGFLRDITGTYTTSFYFMSGCEFISAFIFILGLIIIKKHRK